MSENTKATQAQTDGMAALLAAAVAQGAQAAAGGAKVARSAKKAYGVFVTVPEGALVAVRYEAQTGRELAQWLLVAQDMTWALTMRTKRDALAWLDTHGADVDRQRAAARKLLGGEAQARAAAQAAQREILAHAARTK
jgi:hypothetical protein